MATLKNLRILPKIRDSLSYLYVEHARVDQEAKAIALHDVNGKVPIPCASLTTLMLGPGTTDHPCRHQGFGRQWLSGALDG